VTALLIAALATVPVAHRRVATEDGAALALYRYGEVSGTPILIVTDLGFGRSVADPLAQFLAARGRTVFVAELRGQGAASDGFSLRAMLHLDLPAIARAIGTPVDLIAHGYVGSLAMAAAGRELPVRRVVALNTPFAPEEPTELQEWFLSDGGRFSTLFASLEGFEAFTQLFAMGSEIEGRVSARDLTRATANELLTWMRSGDLPLDDGTTVTQRLRAFDRPTLMFLAMGNAWAPSESCSMLREVSNAKVKFASFSRFTHGDDFAHVTLLRGVNAERFVFRPIEDFLR
jgi:predicted alpha/beta hydrolase